LIILNRVFGIWYVPNMYLLNQWNRAFLWIQETESFHVCSSLCVCDCVFMCVYECVCVYHCMWACVYLHECACTSVWICVSLQCLCVCVCVCVCVFIFFSYKTVNSVSCPFTVLGIVVSIPGSVHLFSSSGIYSFYL
jgi:hypothetical protein